LEDVGGDFQNTEQKSSFKKFGDWFGAFCEMGISFFSPCRPNGPENSHGHCRSDPSKRLALKRLPYLAGKIQLVAQAAETARDKLA